MKAFKMAFKPSFVTVDQNIGESLKCTLATFEASTSCRFQDIAVQNKEFYSYFRYCGGRLAFEKLA